MCSRSLLSVVHRARTRAADESGFALIFALLLIVIISAVSLALAGLVYSQTRPGQFTKKNIRTVNAASAGLQASLGQLRAANDGAGNGTLLELPCTSPTAASFNSGGSSVTASGYTLDGAVSNGQGNLNYTAAVAYYTQDPSGKPLSWLQANAMSCPLSQQPAYAYIQSYGQGDGVPGASRTTLGNRTQHAVYQFATTNTFSVGGRMFEFGTTNPGLCLDAGTSPAIGSTMTFQNCLALGTPRQTWQYRNDLTIFYGGDPSLNLCIQSVSGSPVLRTCTGTGSGSTYPYANATQQAQEWGFNDSGHFAAALSNGTVTNGTGGACLEPNGATAGAPATAGAALVITSCDGATTGYTAWDPDPQVGAGKAGGNITGLPGSPTNQFVNYYEFGRCLDVTGQNVNADHLIAYPCKQAPDSTTLTWNQLWTYTAVSGGYGTFYTRFNNTNYCLTAPSSGNLITTIPCAGSPGNNQLWNATGNIPGNYTASYELVSKLTGGCMSVSRTGAITFGSSNIVLETCDGSLQQKWNAPPTAPATGLGNIQEDAGGGG
jgi:Tfp pilus assembly protein PilX